MTTQGIEQAAEKYNINHADSYLSAGYHWSKAANFVNSIQPYTAEDMKKFPIFCSVEGWISIDRDGNEWFNTMTKSKISFDQLIKLWEVKEKQND